DVPVHFGTLADCLRLVSRHRIDVVHANNVDWPTGISAVREAGARLIVTAHKVREGGWTYGWNRSHCDAFVSVSHWIGRDLQPHTDVAIETVHNGIDTSRFHPARVAAGAPMSAAGRAPIVAWVGRGSAPRKRLDRFAAAAPALAAAGFRVWVIDQQGPARFAEISPDGARQLSAAAERWEGIPHERMPDVYRDIAASGGALISTASMEGLPLTLIEAQACGVPVVAARAEGVDECVLPAHGGTLFNFERDDLAAIVTRTLRDREEMTERGRLAAALVASRFSLTGMAQRYLEIYRRPAAAHRTAVWSHERWARYRDQRLGVAYRQFDAAETLAASGDKPLAAAAARAALATAPTMFARPGRLRRWFGLALTGRRHRQAPLPDDLLKRLT
ncbi:MAG: glycosyltransferase family 4 protein, partial [Vicinamibacterales bacterium]